MDVSDVSAYEAKRLQRIQQNQQMMQSLGFASLQQPRKRRLLTKETEDDPANIAPPRRSSRLQSAVATSTASKPTPLLKLKTSNKKARLPKPASTPKTVDLPVVDETKNAKTVGRRTKRSCLLLNVDLAVFHDRWLGKQIAPKGKQTVVEGMCPKYLPSFSKMSGILSWKNAVVLFVNVLGVSGYDNNFTETSSASATSEPEAEPAAVYFKWFAQARMNEDSPVITRLKAAEPGDSALWMDGQSPTELPDNKQREPVFLFLRHIDGPYIYCGRLGYLGHVPGVQPLQFRWQLLDLGALQWSKVKQLLDASDELAADAVMER